MAPISIHCRRQLRAIKWKFSQKIAVSSLLSTSALCIVCTHNFIAVSGEFSNKCQTWFINPGDSRTCLGISQIDPQVDLPKIRNRNARKKTETKQQIF
jgi:hypothetical protein